MNLRSRVAGTILAGAVLMASIGIAAPRPSNHRDLVETAVAAGSFTTLAKALQAAGLIETLKSEGPFTVFAPTDEAFAKLPAATLQSLMDDPEKLKQILLYHVVSGRVLAKNVLRIKSAKTVQGSSIRITASKRGVMIDNAIVIKADVLASNGVIHVIDSVIIPN